MKLSTIAVTALLVAPLAAQDFVAIKADRVITGDERGTLENAVILIENGKIQAIGTDLEVPWNAKVIDAKGKTVAPTFVLAHTIGGLGGTNERMENVPFLTVQDAIDPSSAFFSECLRNGIGTAHVIPGNNTLLGGIGMIIRPYGKTVEDMTVRTNGGLKLSLNPQGSRMGQIRKMRRALSDAVQHREEIERKKAAFEAEKEAGATKEEKFEEKPDELKKPVLDLIDGKVTGYLYVPSAAEVSEVARMKSDYENMKLVLVLGPTCYKAADRIKALEFPVVLAWNALEYTEKDPETEEETLVCPAKIFADAGVEFALDVDTGTNGANRYPWWQMATLVRHGMDRATAMRSLTTVPAKILGLDDEIGTIEAGKIANLQVMTGDPLQATTWVDVLLLEGEIVYERDTDLRLQHLFGADEKTEDTEKDAENK